MDIILFQAKYNYKTTLYISHKENQREKQSLQLFNKKMIKNSLMGS